MEQHILKIRSIDKVTHDVLRIRLDKPAGYHFIPGQATEVAINQPGWTDEKRPFTFTSLPDDPYLEFTIKTYPSHLGVTNHLRTLSEGDELIIHDSWGAIQYKGEGVFIAGGAGVTPFLSILRDLHRKGRTGNNKLLFANKTKADIICQEELGQVLGSSFVNILSDENLPGYAYGFISREFLSKHITNNSGRYYLCGPPPMMNAVQDILVEMKVGADAVVVEL